MVVRGQSIRVNFITDIWYHLNCINWLGVLRTRLGRRGPMKYSDIINKGSYEEVLQNLNFMCKSINSLAEEMREKPKRNDLNLALHNLLVAAANEIDLPPMIGPPF